MSGLFLRLQTDSVGGLTHSGLKWCLLHGGGDTKVPDARSWELAGVQVGDVLHHFVKGVNVVSLDGQRGLAGVELHLRGETSEYDVSVVTQTKASLLLPLLTLTAEATSSGSCTSRPSLQVYRQSMTFLFSSFPVRIIRPARLPRKN